MADRPLTVFHVDGERGFRGGERQLLYLAAALRARGHANVVCGRAGGALEQEARRLGLETLTLPFWFEFDPVSGWRLARAAAGRPRPIIHAHTGHAAGIALLARWFGGPPTVAHRRVAFPLRRGSRHKYGRMDRLVAVSRTIARDLEEQGLPAERIVVIPDAIPVTSEEWRSVGVERPSLVAPDPPQRGAAREALSRRHGINPGRRWVGSLAALVPEKDHQTLVAAVPHLARRHPGIVVLIAGQGPEERRLRELIERLGVSERVVLLGHLDDPGQLLAAIDLFVHCSTSEGLGSVLLEAAACGVPVVATAAGGIPELVRDRVTGLLVRPGDPIALARGLAELLDDRALGRRLATAALEGLPDFGLARTAEAVEGVYRSVVAG